MIILKQVFQMKQSIEASSRNQSGEEGFTLVELMVVVFIMGLLATVVLVNVMGNVDTSRVKKAQVDIAALESSLDRYRLQLIEYPTTEQGLDALVTAPQDLPNPELFPAGGFIKRLPLDPWNNEYQYVFPGEYNTSGVDVYSLGADGQLGGEGLDADIGNWEN